MGHWSKAMPEYWRFAVYCIPVGPSDGLNRVLGVIEPEYMTSRGPVGMTAAMLWGQATSWGTSTLELQNPISRGFVFPP